jgi:RNA polymerase subunit RPABC4/transcription elongation factor Spt4
MSGRAGKFKFILSTMIMIIFLLASNAVDSYHAQSTSTDVGFDLIISDESTLDEKIEFINQRILLNTELTIKSGEDLSIINSTLIFNTTEATNRSITLLSGSTLNMIDSTIIYGGPDLTNPGLIVHTSNIKIVNSNFISNYVGLSLINISDVVIDQCNFLNNSIGILLDNCENITFSNCIFNNNTESAISLKYSGINENINIINSTIILPGQAPGSESNLVVLNNSELNFINVTYSSNFERKLKLDNSSELSVYWYLNFKTVNENLNDISKVEVLIYYEKHGLIIKGRTDQSGQLKWLLVQEKKILGNESIINYLPIFIEANKKGYSQKIANISNLTNEFEFLNVVLEKTKEDSGDDISETLYMVCTCFIIVIVVFVIMMAINVQIMKRKLGPQGFEALYQKGKKPGESGTIADGTIACSECGTQISADVSFCPHCGEYFEGEEHTCPGCHAVVNEDDTSCPKCGRDFESKSEDTDVHGGSLKKEKLKVQSSKAKDDKQFCSECGAVVKVDEDQCPGCGRAFVSELGESTTGKSKLERTTKSSVSSSSKNKKSGKDVQGLARKITAAEEAKLESEHRINNEDHDDELEISDESYICSMCGATIVGEASKCPKCGIEFE